jgi:hypothetical protein
MGRRAPFVASFYCGSGPTNGMRYQPPVRWFLCGNHIGAKARRRSAERRRCKLSSDDNNPAPVESGRLEFPCTGRLCLHTHLRGERRRMPRVAESGSFPKKIEYHFASLAIQYVYYNVVRIHQTPTSMKSGITLPKDGNNNRLDQPQTVWQPLQWRGFYHGL